MTNCMEYPKVDTLYTRDDNHVITNVIRRPEFLVPAEWLVTEKIDGTNIRISLEEEVLEPEVPGERGSVQTKWGMVIRGRTSRAQIPTMLFEHLQKTFTLSGLSSLWRNGQYPITLCGEGYGGGIQKGGGQYTSKTKGGAVSFRLFDVLVGETWLRRADVEDVAEKLGIKCVPLVLGFTHGGFGVKWDLEYITKYVKEGACSLVAAEEGSREHLAEGIVAFTAEPLYNNRGQRLMFKLKTEDFS